MQAPIVSPAPKVFDVSRALNLMPKFDEDDLDTFFTLFERLADGKIVRERYFYSVCFVVKPKKPIRRLVFATVKLIVG